MKATRLIAVAAVLALVAVPASAQVTKDWLATDNQHGGIGLTPCGGCHQPHSTATNASILLWQYSIGAANVYTVYTSASLQNATTDISHSGDGTLVSGDVENNTLLCLSCHDGALAAANTVTLETAEYGAIGAAITGTAIDVAGDAAELANDHPVNMDYDPALNTSLDTVANVTAAGLTFFGANDSVQCGSCHNPHNNTNQNYLRVSNTSSGLCLTCHL